VVKDKPPQALGDEPRAFFICGLKRIQYGLTWINFLFKYRDHPYNPF